MLMLLYTITISMLMQLVYHNIIYIYVYAVVCVDVYML
jgi:hypothetical protein